MANFAYGLAIGYVVGIYVQDYLTKNKRTKDDRE